MNRNKWVAAAYGLACVVVGFLLIREGNPAVEREGSRVDSGTVGAEAGAGRGVGFPWHPTGETEMAEVGPDGIRFVSAVETNGEGVGAGVGRRSAGWLPESGRELLALNDAIIQAVADSLKAAGATSEDLETGLQSVYGHVLRLASFTTIARLEVEGGPGFEAETANPGSDERSRMPSLQWRSEVWARRSREYQSYLRRDLEMRLGIRDEALVERLLEIAEAMAARDGGTGSGGVRPGGPASPNTP
ncbi:MAG: hypothetical protein AB7O66_11805 [Limisphaerales bacterium]